RGCACSRRGCERKADPTGGLELGEVDPLLDRVRTVLASTERYRRDAVPHQAVRVEPAVGDAQLRGEPQLGDGGHGAANDGGFLAETERQIGSACREADASTFAVAAGQGGRAVRKRVAVGVGDLPAEAAVVATAFTP